jgi:hypothetical protein
VPEYKLSIKTEADLKAAKQMEADLKKVLEATKAVGGETKHLEAALKRTTEALNSDAAAHARRAGGLKSAIEVTKRLGGDTKELNKELAAANAALGKRETMMSRMGRKFETARDAYGQGYQSGGMIGGGLAVAGLMNPAVAAGLVAGATALKTASKGLDEYAKAEREVFKLNGALALRGQLTKEYSEELQEMSSELQNATGIADEAFLRVFTTLTKGGADPENIKKLTKGVEDLAGLMGGDVETAAAMMAKAMQGNFTMLSRWGVQVDKNATQAEKLDSVLQQVASRGAGQLRAGAEGLGGAFDRVKNSAGDLWENLGNGINRMFGIDLILGKTADGMKWLAEKTFLAIEPAKGLKNSIDGLPEVIEDSGAAAAKTSEDFKKLAEELDSVKEKADLAKAAIDRAKGIQDDEAAARKKLDMATVDDDVARGRISKTQGEVRKARIEQRYAGEALVRQDDRDASIQQVNQQMRDAIIAQEAQAAAKVEALRKKLTPEEALAAATARHSAASKDAALLREQIDAGRTAQTLIRMAGPNSAGPIQTTGNLDELRARLNDVEQVISREGQFVSSRRAQNQTTRAQLTAAEEARAQQSQLSAAELARLDAEQQGIGAQRASRQRIFSMDTRTRATQLGTDLYEMRTDPKAVDEVRASVNEVRKLNAELITLQRDFTAAMLDMGFQNREDMLKAMEALREIKSVQQKTNRQ